MNDFLKSLRSNSKDKRFDRNSRRPYNPQHNGNSQYNRNPQYRNGEEVNGNLKRGYSNELSDKIAKLIEESLPEIKKLMEGISESQKRRADAEERKAKAFENIAESMQSLLKSGELPLANASEKKYDPETDDDSNASVDIDSMTNDTVMSHDRESVLNTIFTMREKGTTFGEIASYLDSENIPTFSGKGAWHAQTIHRICKKMDN